MMPRGRRVGKQKGAYDRIVYDTRWLVAIGAQQKQKALSLGRGWMKDCTFRERG